MKEKHYTIKELPTKERPYEKCEQFGAACLSDAELLAVIIRTGSREKNFDRTFTTYFSRMWWFSWNP